MTTQTERRYIPKPGVRVRMPLFSDYTEAGLEPWTTLIAKFVTSIDVTCERPENGGTAIIPLTKIQPPVGWQSRYTIHVQPDKVDDVLAWLKRGISVRFSQYIGDGSTVFQPLDNSETPHWKYTEQTDTLTAEETVEYISVVKVESGSGRDVRELSEMEPRKERKAAIATLEREGWKVWYQKRGGAWMMERETVIKEFGKEAQ